MRSKEEFRAMLPPHLRRRKIEMRFHSADNPSQQMFRKRALWIHYAKHGLHPALIPPRELLRQVISANACSNSVCLFVPILAA